MSEACLAAVDVTAFFVPGFATFSMEIVFPFCFSIQMTSSDAENLLVSLRASRDTIFNCTSPE